MVDEEEMTAYYEITLGASAVIMTCMAEDNRELMRRHLLAIAR